MKRRRIQNWVNRSAGAEGPNFPGRTTGGWNARACLLGLLSRLVAEHQLSKGFCEGVIELADTWGAAPDRLVALIRELAELCRGPERTAAFFADLDGMIQDTDRARSMLLDSFPDLVDVAVDAGLEQRVRNMLRDFLLESGGRVPQAAELSRVEAFASIKETFGLEDDDLPIIAFLFCDRTYGSFSDLCAHWGPDDFHYGVSVALGLPESRVKARLSSQSPLLQSGVVEAGGPRDATAVGLSNFAFIHIANGGTDLIGGSYVEPDSGPVFALDSFSVPEKQREALVDLVAAGGGGTGLNILLYGKEGSGKTQFARSVVSAAGKELQVFRQEERAQEGEPDDLMRLSFIGKTLEPARSVILVDEAEDLLATASPFGMFGTHAPSRGKARIHDILDQARCPIVWIVNSVARMDASTRRRFSFAVEFGALAPETLKRLARAWLDGIDMDEHLREGIATMAGRYGLPASSFEWMRGLVSSIIASGKDAGTILERVRSLFESNVKLLTGREPPRADCVLEYDPDALSISVTVDRVLSLVRNAYARIDAADRPEGGRHGMRLLFHGSSGTGKTELARHIAETLDRPLLCKRASDILAPYVGQNEQNIKRIFAEAEATKAILLVDEADSFFYDRSGAQRSWERTLVNEFLVQMETFRGVMICSTNYPSILDKALARRFHESVEFKSLSRDAVTRLLARYYPELAFEAGAADAIVKAGPITAGDFGALKGRTDYLDPGQLSADYVTNSLVELARAKKPAERSVIGFGVNEG